MQNELNAMRNKNLISDKITGASVKVNNLRKNIARLATATKYLLSSDKHGRRLN